MSMMSAAAKLDFILDLIEGEVFTAEEGTVLLKNSDRWGDLSLPDGKFSQQLLAVLVDHGFRLTKEIVSG